MKLKETNNYCDISELKISALPLDKDIYIIYDEENIIFPYETIITRVCKDKVLVTPTTWLYELDNLLDETCEEMHTLKYFINVVQHIRNTIKALRKFSLTDPDIIIDGDSMKFYYTITLKGKKISDIYHQLKQMYEEIDANDKKYPDICEALIEDKI